MLDWIIQNLANIVICLVLILAVTLAVVKLVKDKKAGRSSCGCGCAHCAMRGECHSQKGTISK